MAERPDSTPDLAAIDVPTLVITSDLDTLIPAGATSPMADAIPGAELAVIDGVGHLSNLEAAASVRRSCSRITWTGACRGDDRPRDPPVDWRS